MKKVISLVLCVMLILSSFSIAASAYLIDLNVNQAIELHEKETGEKVDTYRYFFLMPNGSNGMIGEETEEYEETWYNDNSDHAGIYWWDCDVADPDGWPGYEMEEYDSDCVYYADVPVDVTTVIFNNHLDGGMDNENPIYYDAHQTVNIGTEYYDPGESDNYPDGTESFDNMIYVIHPDWCSVSEIGIKHTVEGEWYYYYGHGCFGTVKDGNETNCIRDDHDHNDHHEEFLEYLGIAKEDSHTYSKPLYYHYKENTNEPEWFLAHGYAGSFLPDDMLYGVFSDYYLYGCSIAPSQFSYHVYVIDEQKFYPIEEIWDTDLCGKEEIFTQYLVPNKSAKLLGDADEDGQLSVMDATMIQMAEAQMTTIYDWIMATHRYGDKIEFFTDFDHDGERSVMDATAIQLKLAHFS